MKGDRLCSCFVTTRCSYVFPIWSDSFHFALANLEFLCHDETMGLASRHDRSDAGPGSGGGGGGGVYRSNGSTQPAPRRARELCRARRARGLCYAHSARTLLCICREFSATSTLPPPLPMPPQEVLLLMEFMMLGCGWNS